MQIVLIIYCVISKMRILTAGRERAMSRKWVPVDPSDCQFEPWSSCSTLRMLPVTGLHITR